MNKALISLGANHNNRIETLKQTIEIIKQDVKITACTPVYESNAEGKSTDKIYANALLLIESETDFDTLYNYYKQLEKEAGRTPAMREQGIVPLDIDIVKWNDHILKPRDMNYQYMQKGLEMLTNNI